MIAKIRSLYYDFIFLCERIFTKIKKVLIIIGTVIISIPVLMWVIWKLIRKSEPIESVFIENNNIH